MSGFAGDFKLEPDNEPRAETAAAYWRHSWLSAERFWGAGQQPPTDFPFPASLADLGERWAWRQRFKGYSDAGNGCDSLFGKPFAYHYLDFVHDIWREVRLLAFVPGRGCVFGRGVCLEGGWCHD